jgi:hypothetical protein
LYLASKNSNNLGLKKYYKLHVKILSNITEEAKKINHNQGILKSSSKNKTILDIIKLETGKNFSNADIHVLVIDNGYSCDQQVIADAFNNYFHSIDNTITNNNTHNKTGTNKILLPLLFIFYDRSLNISFLL